MSQRLCTTARSASYTALLPALLVTVSVLLSTLLPTGVAWATVTTTVTADSVSAAVTTTAAATRPTAAGATADGCPDLPLAPFGDPGSAIGEATVPAQESVCFTFTAERPGTHRVLLDDSHNNTYLQVFDGEDQLECYDSAWSSEGWCPLPRAGAFTLKVVNNGWADPDEATVTVTPLASTANCAPETGTSWDSPPVSAAASSPVGIVCHPFTGTAGERITVDFRTVRHGSHESWITDTTGARICPRFTEDDSTGCVLPGDGPYRVLARVVDAEGGFPADYTLKVRRLSDPAGCARVPVNAYNSAPTTSDPATGCKTFTALADGRYDVYGVSDGSRARLTVYDRAGKTVCTTWEACFLTAAGDYTVLTDDATLILDRAATAGCEPARLGTHEGAFTSPGEIDCLSLPLPEGARAAALKPLGGAGPNPGLVVVDATGTQTCDGTSLSSGTCPLTGTGPFRVLVSTDDSDRPTGSYRFALHRTDIASDCPAVPAGDFTATGPAARFTTGGGVFSHCLAIPADGHTAAENLQLQAVSGTSTAQVSVLDADGGQVCELRASLSTWTTCALTPGAAHTVLVTGRDTPATYTLTRRDVTATAEGCTATPAGAVGGPSTGGTPAAPGTLLCHQVTTADAGDTLHLNVRDPLGTANILAYDARGEAVCSYRNGPCAVTGSTRYQVLVTVPVNLRPAPGYRLDALRVATAAGPAAECVRVPNVSYGYGPVTGTLDEQHTAFCAALPTAYRDRFDFAVSDTTGAAETAVPALYGSGLTNGCTQYIPTGYQCSLNEPYSTGVTPSILVVGLPEKAPRTSYRAELVCASVRCGPEQVSIGSVTPATGVGGTKVTVTVTGTALHADDRVRITRSGGLIESTTTSVSPDRKSLTAVLDLAGAAAGTWNLSVITHNAWEYGKGVFIVTQAPLKNATAPAISGTAQVGGRLTATPGSWTPAPASYAYQWKADGTPVPGATAAAYTVPASLLGKKLTVAVTARGAGPDSVVATSTAVTVAKGAAPKAGAAPKISGTVRVGTKVTVVPGTWTPAATSYAYQWKADGKAISGATASGYTVSASLAGKKLTATVTARRAGHADGTATTSSATVAKGVAPKAGKLPVITGTAKAGRRLTASRGTWTPAPSSYGYQWYANGKAIAGATKSALTLTSAQRGARITVKVTAHRGGHASGSALSRATGAVAR